MSNQKNPHSGKYHMNPKAAAYRDQRRQGISDSAAYRDQRRQGKTAPPVSKRRKRKKSKAFRTALLIYTLSLFVILSGVCVFIGFKLSDYQKGIDSEEAGQEYKEEVRRAPQLAFEDFADNATAEELTDLWFDSHPEHYDSQEAVINLMQSDIIDANLTRFKSADSTADKPQYILKNSERMVARFTLDGIEKDWKVSSAEFFFEGKEYSVTAPSDSDVSINGVAPDKKLISETQGFKDDDVEEGILVNPVSYDTYTIPGVIGNAEFNVFPGREYSIEELEGSKYYYCLTDEEASGLISKASDFVKALLKYYCYGSSNTGGNMNTVLSYVTPSSQAYKIIAESKSGVEWRHSYPNVTYELNVGKVVCEADNVRRVDISYQKVGDPQNDVTYEGIYRIFFLDKGNGYGIYKFELQ